MALKLITLCFILASASTVNAKEFQDLNIIRTQVSQYLYSLSDVKQNKETKISVHSIDSRLKLSKCNSLSFNLASGSQILGKTSVRVICSTPKPWSFYITASIARFDKVIVLNGSFGRGHIIKSADIYAIRKDLSKLPFGYVTNQSQVIGKQLKRHVQAGRVLTPSQLTNPLVIKRGEIVALQKKTSGFMVSMKGTALSNGAIGDKIRVKNSSSKRIIEGRISRAGIVVIDY